MFYQSDIKTLLFLPLIGLMCKSCQQQEGRPNILFAIADDMSYGHTSYNGYPQVKTPAFDKIAGEGMVFTRAYVSAPSCSPSRAAILTGRNGYELEEGGVLWAFLPEKFDVYPEILALNGYHSGFTGKGWGPGDLKLANRSENPAGKAYNNLRAAQALGTLKIAGLNTIDYFRNFKDFMSDRAPGQPFCFWYGATEPHRPYHTGIGKLAGKDTDAIDVPPFLPDNENTRSDIADYLFEIEYYDSHLLMMMNYLDSIGELDNTIVVMTSDNGMPFPRAKANLYEYGTRMPLAIRWGRQKAREINDFISFTDFAPTFLEAAKIPVPGHMSGKSFFSLLISRKSGLIDPQRTSAVFYKERHAWSQPHGACVPMRGLRRDKWLLIHNLHPDIYPVGHPDPAKNFSMWPFSETEEGPAKTEVLKRKNQNSKIDYFKLAFETRPEYELYDVENDPFQLNNLASEEKFNGILSSLILELSNRLMETNDPRATGVGIDRFCNAPYFFTQNAETGWIRPELWDKLSTEEKEKHIKEKLNEIEKNKKTLNEWYEEQYYD